ncbi:MAG: hypothetical protein NVSMB52_03740 [Chloroflexota bacterium]
MLGVVAMLLALAVVHVPSHTSAAGYVVVNPANMHGWAFGSDSPYPPGTGELVNGPAKPPLGTGSARLAVTPAQRELLGTGAYTGKPLASFTELNYWTYKTSGDPQVDIALQIDIIKADNHYGGRAVYEPYFNGTVTPGLWQNWDARHGLWWGSHIYTGPCSQSSPCPYDALIAMYPGATAGGVYFKAGGPWTFDGNVDAFTISVLGDTTVYDFEARPTSRQDCENGGYKAFTHPSFDSEKDCLKYVKGHGDDNGNNDDNGDHDGHGHHGDQGDIGDYGN